MSPENNPLKFSSRPPEAAISKTIDIVRTPTNGSHSGIVLNSEIIGHDVHYWDGRSIPCIPGNCAACEGKREPRWYAYFALWLPKKRETICLELTAKAIVPVLAWVERGESLRGAQIMVRRKQPVQTSRIVTTIDKGKFSPHELPESFDIAELLCRVWGVKRDFAEEAGDPRKTPYAQHFLGGKDLPKTVRESMLLSRTLTAKEKHELNGSH